MESESIEDLVRRSEAMACASSWADEALSAPAAEVPSKETDGRLRKCDLQRICDETSDEIARLDDLIAATPPRSLRDAALLAAFVRHEYAAHENTARLQRIVNSALANLSRYLEAEAGIKVACIAPGMGPPASLDHLIRQCTAFERLPAHRVTP